MVAPAPTLTERIGNTPLVRLLRLPESGTVWAKLEGNNPAGSVKDRAALSMIRGASGRGEIVPGDTLIEATSGNTGIALAMVAAIEGYRMVLIMPDNLGVERRAVMRAFGAELILVPESGGMEEARDLALQMQRDGKGRVLDQFSNPDNWRAHFEGTGPEIWEDTGGHVTHVVSAMGTTGTVMGVSRYLKQRDQAVQIVGVQPSESADIPGIRRWSAAYLPEIFERDRVDRTIDVSREDAEETTRLLAEREGIFAGISSGAAVAAALRVACDAPDGLVVAVICDRGDRYLSTGVFRS